jgi:hypothetical protein
MGPAQDPRDNGISAQRKRPAILARHTALHPSISGFPRGFCFRKLEHIVLERRGARPDAVAAEGIDGPGREAGQLDRTAKLLYPAAVTRKHERDGLGRDLELLGNLAERVAKAAQGGYVAYPLR